MNPCGGVALPIVGPVGVGESGMRRGKMHHGIDLYAPQGTPVHSVMGGTVVASAPSGELDRLGNTVVVAHAPDLYTLYSHLAARLVQVGTQVQPGAVLGTVGTTAGTRARPAAVFASSRPHLHLGTLTRWPPRDPSMWLNPRHVLAGLGVLIPRKWGRMSHQSCPEDLPPRRRIRRSSRFEGSGWGVLLVGWLIARNSQRKGRP